MGVVASLSKKAMKEDVGLSLVSQRLLERQFHILYEDSCAYLKKKNFGYFRISKESFDTLLSMIKPYVTDQNTYVIMTRRKINFSVSFNLRRSSSSSSSSYICHGVGPLVDPFRSHVSRSLFKGLRR